MASYTSTGCSAHHTLTASTVDTVTLDARYPVVEIINRDSSNALWVTVEYGSADTAGTAAPTVAGDGSFYVGPGAVRTFHDIYDVGASDSPTIAKTTVQLISSAAVAYSVTGIHGWQ